MVRPLRLSTFRDEPIQQLRHCVLGVGVVLARLLHEAFSVHLDNDAREARTLPALPARSPAPGRPGRRAQGLGTTVNIEAKTRYANQAGPLAPAKHAKSIRNKECKECHDYTHRRQGHGKVSASRY